MSKRVNKSQVDKMMDTKYSFEPVIGINPRILILGSLPGPDSLKSKQYYAHERNSFWKIISEILGVELPSDYESRMKLIHDSNLALWDSAYSAIREGALDSRIKQYIPNDIPRFLVEHSSIERIVFNGAKAMQIATKSYPGLCDRVECIKVSSTSPACTKGFEIKEKQWREALMGVKKNG